MFKQEISKSSRCNTILVVDDDPNMLKMIEDIILDNALSANIIQCEDPIRAIELYHQNKAGITHVILDYNMPKDSGLELAKILKENNPNLNIAIFSGYDLPNTESFENTVCQFIKKPDLDKILNFIF